MSFLYGILKEKHNLDSISQGAGITGDLRLPLSGTHGPLTSPGRETESTR